MSERRRAAASHVLADADAFDQLRLPDDVEHHVRSVLRLRDGAVLSITDGAGRWRMCRLVVEGRSIVVEPDGEIATEPRVEPPITVGAAIPKGDRLEWMIQKATELGADRVVLLHAERSVVRWKEDRIDRHLDRLRRIADQATRQSRRVWRTEIVGPVVASEFLADAVVAEPGGRPIEAADRTVAVGPEGGWTARELACARDSIGLGPHVLRTETAAVASVTLCVAANH